MQKYIIVEIGFAEHSFLSYDAETRAQPQLVQKQPFNSIN